MELKAQTIYGTEYKGPLFECDLDEQQMLFQPSIIRIDPSFPEYCCMSIKVVSISSGGPVSFCWSTNVKEVNWSSPVESLNEGGYTQQIRTFKNNKLKGLNKLSLSIYVRPAD